MRDDATYANAVQRGVVGNDPLGLASTNERLYNSAFPGFNNYVRYIRVYSAICWMIRQAVHAVDTGPSRKSREVRSVFRDALQKIELLLVWTNQGAGGLAGSDREFPLHDKPVKLSFETFGASVATLFDAPTYKPSLTNGLGFLESRDAGIFRCLDAGNKLADAFDANVRPLPGYRLLKAVDRLEMKRTQAKALAPALDVGAPSPAERAAFLDRFFPEQMPSVEDNNDRARWQTLMLMLRSVQAVCQANSTLGEEDSATVDEIRACMARGLASDGTSVISTDTETVQSWWAVLQVRQLQRLAQEALYCVVERWIGDREAEASGLGLDDCIAQLSKAAVAHIAEHLRDQVGQLEAFLREVQGEHASLYEAAAHWQPEGDDEINEADVFTHMERFKDRTQLHVDAEGNCEGMANAYIGLVFCAVATQDLMANPQALKALQGDGDLCSLLRLNGLMSRMRTSSVEGFLAHVLKEWVVLRHFAVAGSRTEPFDGKNRFRFILGDYGLERFDRGARLPVPAMSSDKMYHALLLCEQGGLLAWRNQGYRLTAPARTRLRAFKALKATTA